MDYLIVVLHQEWTAVLNELLTPYGYVKVDCVLILSYF